MIPLPGRPASGLWWEELNIKQIQQSELLNIYRAQAGQIVLINWGLASPTLTA